MPFSLQSTLQHLILCRDFSEKITWAQKLTQQKLQIIPKLAEAKALQLKSPGRPESFRVVPPRSVPKRSFQNLKDRSSFLHAIANIELLAIELPALCLLRFGCDDLQFLQTQLKIMQEEASHFFLLQTRLQQLGCEFGTLPSHNGLWTHAWKCQSELEHQIVIPCYLEARGLDVTPDFIHQLQNCGDIASANILEIIQRDEIEHVKKGQLYLEQKAQEQNTTALQLFEKTLNDFFQGKVKSKVKVHRHNRLLAGFSNEMIDVIA